MSSVAVRYTSLAIAPMVEKSTESAMALMSTSGWTCVIWFATSAGWNTSSEYKYDNGANWVT